MFWVRGPSWRTGRIAGAGINRQPEPERVLRAAQPGSQFIQLEVWELQIAEEPLVQHLRMLACTRQPAHDGGLSKAEDAFGSEIGSNPSASAESTVAIC